MTPRERARAAAAAAALGLWAALRALATRASRRSVGAVLLYQRVSAQPGPAGELVPRVAAAGLRPA